MEDLPGLGKTTLAKAIARAVGGEFSRVQCTPDLLPTDITGFSIFNQATRQFEFQRGPSFHRCAAGGRDQSRDTPYAKRPVRSHG